MKTHNPKKKNLYIVLLTSTDVDNVAKSNFMPDMKVWTSSSAGMWCTLGGVGAKVTLLFLLQWRKINICLTVADHWKIEWVSSGSQISLTFFSLLEGWIPKQMCLQGTGHQVEGCTLSEDLVLGLNLEVGGQMKVRVTVRLGSQWGQSIQPP